MPNKKRPRRRTKARPLARRTIAFAQQLDDARASAFERTGPEAFGRDVKVVAEGDSWFSYFPAHDILACLRNRTWNGWGYAVEDRAKAGALLNDMVYGRDMVDTYELLERHKPDVFLFSGGGNDIAGQELFVMLYNRKAVELHNNLPHINKQILRGLVDEVFLQAYQDLIDLLRFKMNQIGKPDMPIIFHGYDYAIPDGRGWGSGIGPLPGPWLDPSLSRKGYERKADAVLRRKLVRELIDAFNEMLAVVARRNANTHYAGLRDTLADNQWANELHPTKAGFVAVTAKVEAQIRKVITELPSALSIAGSIAAAEAIEDEGLVDRAEWLLRELDPMSNRPMKKMEPTNHLKNTLGLRDIDIRSLTGSMNAFIAARNPESSVSKAEVEGAKTIRGELKLLQKKIDAVELSDKEADDAINDAKGRV